ncbi:MAG TPA: PD-(D/E)XK nuclease family protein [Thermoanaerobaculia bacterium]
MTVTLLPYRQLASDIASRLVLSRESAAPLDPWQVEVIVPSQAVADAIAASLMEHFPRGLAGLRLQTLEALARRFVPGRVASEAERRLAMRTAVRVVDHPMTESRGIAAMLERAYRDVRDSGISLAEFADRVRRTSRLLRNASRTQAIVRIWTEYERLIAQLGVLDPADLLTRAAAVAGKMQPQLVAGFYDMTGVQRQVVEALREGGRLGGMWVPTDMPFARRLIDLDCGGNAVALNSGAAPRLWESGGVATAVQIYDTHLAELSGVCANVRALLESGVDPRSIAIVARSLEPYDARLLNRFAREHGFATTLTDEIPLTAQRIGRGVVTLLRLAERGYPRAEVLELVRDGLRTRTAINVNEVDAATRRARIAGGTSAELAPFRNQRRRELDDYLSLVAELEELTPALDASRFRIETERDLAAAEAIDEVAALFRRTAVWNRGLDVPSMLDALERVTLPAAHATDLPKIWCGDVMRFRGRWFSHLFAVRMQDDVFPQRRTEDPLVPDSDRERLGVRTIGDGRDEEELLLQLVHDGSESLTFTYASTDGFGKALRPSRFLRGLPARPASPENQGRAESPHHTLRSLQLLAKSGTRSVFDGYLTTLYPFIREKVSSISPTQLEDFGECPQKFLLKHLLGVQDIDHPERELQIDHRDKGILDHRILERLYRELTPERFALASASLPRLPREIVTRLEELIDAAFDEHAQKLPPFNRTVRDIERRATKRILRDFLAHDLADLEANGLTPRFFEYRFGGKHREPDHPEPFLVQVDDATVRVEGTIDRIDSGDDRFRIVDYKSGKARRHENLGGKIDRGVRLQLGLYAMAVASFFDADPARVSATIKPLVVDDLKPAKFAFSLADKQEGLLETLRIFLSAILSSTFPAFPNEGDFDSCKYCPVNHSCRTKHDLDERYAIQQAKDPRTLLAGAFAR